MARVIVIGAGPAGSAAAFHLAGAGHVVTLIERTSFPRIKVCGEFISPGATAILEELAPRTDLLAAGAVRVDHFVLEAGACRTTWPLPVPAWAVSRSTLDALLARRAERAGCSVVQPASVRSVAYADDGAVVRLADGRSLRSDVVIHADGSGRHDPCGPVPHDRRLIGLKCHLDLEDGSTGVCIRAARGAYIGTIGVEGRSATCALVARKELLAAFGGDQDRMLASLWPGFDPLRRTSEWKSCGVARSGYRRPGHLRSFRIGNAAAAVDPIGGEGIGLALWSGRELARALAETGFDLLRAQRALGMAYARRLRTRLPACRAAAELLLRARMVRAVWPLTRAPGLVLSPWYGLTGKRAATG